MQVKMLSYKTKVEYLTGEKCKNSTKDMNDDCNQNIQHMSRSRGLRQIVKRLLKGLKRKQVLKKTFGEIQEQNAYNSSLEDMRKHPVALCANDENAANEALEARLKKEMRHCAGNAAVIVQLGQEQHILPVHPEQSFIPVHFARTSNGTFFWTSMDVTRQQEMELRVQLDRWVQA